MYSKALVKSVSSSSTLIDASSPMDIKSFIRKAEKAKWGGNAEGFIGRHKVTGEDFLIKRLKKDIGVPSPEDNWRSEDEILASRLFTALGGLAPKMFPVIDPKTKLVYVASLKIPNTVSCKAENFKRLPFATKNQVYISQFFHCWIANRDVVNARGENYVVDADKRVFNVDFGACLFSGFRNLFYFSDAFNFTEGNINPFFIKKGNGEFCIIKSPKGESEAWNKPQMEKFFSELFDNSELQRSSYLQGAILLSQLSKEEIYAIVDSTGHTEKDKQDRKSILIARQKQMLKFIKQEYGKHAIREEEISLMLQRIFHKKGLFIPFTAFGMGSDAQVSFGSQYENALKPKVRIHEETQTIDIIIPKDSNENFQQAVKIIHDLGLIAVKDSKSMTLRLSYSKEHLSNLKQILQRTIVENALQIFFNSYGYERHYPSSFAYKGDGDNGFRPLIEVNEDLLNPFNSSLYISLPPTATPEAMLNLFQEKFNIPSEYSSIDKSDPSKGARVKLTNLSLEKCTSYFMSNTGARKTAIVSEGEKGTVLAGKLIFSKKGTTGFATAGGISDFPYHPEKAAIREANDEFGFKIPDNTDLLPLGSTLLNKQENIFLVPSGGTAKVGNPKAVGYQEFQPDTVKYYQFSELRKAGTFDRSSIFLYSQYYEKEIQKLLDKKGIQDVVVHICRKPTTLGQIVLKPCLKTTKEYTYRPSLKCIELINKLAIPFKVSPKKSDQNPELEGRHVIKRDYIILADDINPATFYEKLNADVLSPVASMLDNKAEALRTCLVQKIDDYLEWRNNKGVEEEGRKYEFGFFTRLRHYTRFGQNRAEALKSALYRTTNETELFTALREHFSHSSKLNNHSLDTYLLEGVLDKSSMPIVLNANNKYNLSNKASREILRQEVQTYKPTSSL